MNEQDRQVLVGRIAARCLDADAAMTRLYRDLDGCVCAFVRRRLRGADEHEVQGVVAATMYEVWLAACNFSGDSLVKTWVLGIARHKLLDAARKNLRWTQHHVDIDACADLADPNGDIVAMIAVKQRVQWLADRMRMLPVIQGELLRLLLVEGLSMEEISVAQGCPLGTVKTRLFHAKAKLKICVQQTPRPTGDPVSRCASESSPARR